MLVAFNQTIQEYNPWAEILPLEIVLLESDNGVSHPRMRKWGLLLERVGIKHQAPWNYIHEEEGLIVGLIRWVLLVLDKNSVMWKKKRNFNHVVFSLKNKQNKLSRNFETCHTEEFSHCTDP